MADHLMALTTGMRKVLKAAFAVEQAKAWGPRKGARPRLKGMGITTVIAAAKIEVSVTDQEKKRLEDMSLRLRRVRHHDLEAMRRGALC